MRNISDDDIQDYLDDNLSPLQREYFETAMQRNHALAERIEEYRAVKSALKSEKAPLGSHEFVDAVMARIETVEPNPAAQGWRALDWLSLSAAAALVVGLVYLVGFSEVFELLREIPTPNFSWVASAMASVEEELKLYAGLLPYAGFSAAAALTFSILDRLFLISRYERIRS